MRANLQRGLLIVLLAANYTLQVPDLLRQGFKGSGALVFGALWYLLFIVLLIRRSSKGALFLGVLAMIGAGFSALQYFVMLDMVFHQPRPPLLWFLLRLAVVLIVAVGSLDLWSIWKNQKPNQTAHPTTL